MVVSHRQEKLQTVRALKSERQIIGCMELGRRGRSVHLKSEKTVQTNILSGEGRKHGESCGQRDCQGREPSKERNWVVEWQTSQRSIACLSKGFRCPGSPTPRHLDLMSITTKLREISGRDCEWAAFTAIQFYFSSSQLYSYRFAYLLILSCVDHISWDS